MKHFCPIPAYMLRMLLAFMLTFMPMNAVASDRISEDLSLDKQLNLKSFDFEPKEVKMDGPGETVTFLATIYAENGLMGKKLTDFATSATFLGPHSVSHPFQRDQITVTFLPPPILGDEKNGSYKGSLLLKSDIEEGFWQLDCIKLVDSTGSVRELRGDDLGSLPKELIVEVGVRKWVTILLLVLCNINFAN